MLEKLALKKVIDLIKNPVIICDESDRIILVNIFYTSLTGWTQEEMKNQPSALACEFESLTEEEKINYFQSKNKFLRAKLKIKNKKYLEIQATKQYIYHPVEGDLLIGKIIIFQGEIELEKEKQEKNFQDEILNMIGHEFRSPLTSIKGFAETLLKSGDKIPKDNQEHFLNIIKSQANHLERLVEDLFFVSRLDKKQVNLMLRPVGLKKITDKVCDSLQSGGRLFIYEFQDNLPEIIADSDRLEQVLRNLLINAVKYSPEDSSIKIQASLNKNKIKISVIDNGFGIKQEYKNCIFEKFKRATDNSCMQKTEGYGLGLYISKCLIEAMNGEIWLEKSDETGSIFSFTLPAN